ncbi:MAG: hypothetical protein ABRQ24_05455 [Syntrophomonadaceae bacterium]
MKDLIDRVEKGLIRFVIIGIVIMVVVQGFMSVDPIRLYLSWGERMEGENIRLPVAATKTETDDPDVEEAVSPQARLALEISHFSSLPRARILVNGSERTSFNGKQVNLAVQAGDTVEIDATAYNFPIEFSVTAVSSNLVFPEKNLKYTANQTMVMIGKVIVK